MIRLPRALSWPRYGIGPRAYLRLRRAPRGRPATAPLFGRELRILDPIDFLSGVHQIFGQGVYAFDGAGPRPRILDCGANIGLSCIYFRRRFPRARLTAFEPDPAIATALRANLAAFGLDDVELVQAAAWTSAGTAAFARDGTLGGRLADAGEPVATVRLRDWLAEPVDLLKLDVEGAETTVLADCADRLGAVARLFVEYHGAAGSPQTLHQVLAILADAGFRCYLREEYAPAQPFLARPSRAGFDTQLAIYAVRT